MMFLRGRAIGACQRMPASGTRGTELAESTVCRRCSQASGPASMSASSDAVAGSSGVPAVSARQVDHSVGPDGAQPDHGV